MASLNRKIFTSFFLVSTILGAPPVYGSQVPVSATVPSFAFNPPNLLSPTANATINTARPSFSWSRPSPVPTNPLSHYDYYLDNQAFASSLSDSLSSVDFYFYSATASGGIFYLSLKTDLTQGYHTWRVIAYDSNNASASSETRNLYVDSVPPFISLAQVESKALNWNTAIPSSLPSVENRYLSISTSNPLLRGTVETYSNLQIILMCPQNIPTCSNQIYSQNSSSGSWEYRFAGLLSGITYTVKISATDASNNSTIFPDFFLTFGTPLSPTSASTLTPTAAATSGAEPTLPLPGFTVTPPPGLLTAITPTVFIPQVPPPPTPPPPKREPLKLPSDLFYIFLLVLIIFGLPLHLAMAAAGTETPLLFIPKFLLILAYPFLRKKRYQTSPFTFITIFISNKLNRPWQSVVSDINGYFDLKNPIPENLFIHLSSAGKTWKDVLYKGHLIPISCFYLTPVRSLTGHKRFLKLLYDVRIIPLIIACLTSITAFIIQPSYPILIYIYFSLQYLYSEYLYPKKFKQEDTP